VGKVCSAGACQNLQCPLTQKLIGGPGFDSIRAATGYKGGLIAVGTQGISGGPDVGWLMRVDSAVNLAWEATVLLGGDTTPRAVDRHGVTEEFSAVGGYWTAAGDDEDAFIARFTADGEQLWLKTYGDNLWDRFSDVEASQDGSAIAVGQLGGPLPLMAQGWIVRVNNSGDVLWEQKLGYQSNDAFHAIDTVPGGYIVAGWTVNAPPWNDQDCFVARIDKQGGVVWEKKFGGPGDQTLTTVDGGSFAIYGFGRTTNNPTANHDGLMVALLLNGQVEWQQAHGDPFKQSFASAATAGGGFIAVGTTDANPSTGQDGWLFALDSGGFAKWQKTLGDSGANFLNDAVETNNGQVWAVGSTPSAVPGNFNDGWIVRLDSAGNADCSN
jgi:hypothetical protein